jgi:ComF family protein
MLGAFDMEGVARQLVHAIKYRGVRDLALLMAERMHPLRDRRGFDMAVAVPLHRSRERRRGFNQAAEILRHTGWPQLEGPLVRVRKTDTQVGMSSGERRANISNAFAWHGPPLDGRSVAVVDDVITTGATANECARVLKENGARHVVALAFARASYEPVPGAPILD